MEETDFRQRANATVIRQLQTILYDYTSALSEGQRPELNLVRLS